RDVHVPDLVRDRAGRADRADPAQAPHEHPAQRADARRDRAGPGPDPGHGEVLMRILVVGAGGVGTAAVGIAARRDFFEHCLVTDYDRGRAERAVPAGDARFGVARIDASSAATVTDLCREHRITHVLNAVDPRFVMPIFQGALAADAHYLDMAMSLSKPHETEPYAQVGI